MTTLTPNLAYEFMFGVGAQTSRRWLGYSRKNKNYTYNNSNDNNQHDAGSSGGEPIRGRYHLLARMRLIQGNFGEPAAGGGGQRGRPGAHKVALEGIVSCV